MKVRATARGFLGGGLKNIGEEFEVPDGKEASWWVPVDDTAQEKPEAEVVKDKPKPKKKAKAKKKS